jgi:hypothetical protein
MTKDEARAYVKYVHDRVDGRVFADGNTNNMLAQKGPIKWLKANGRVILRDLKGKPPMPEYDHDKYIEAKKVLCIYGKDVKEPGKESPLEAWEELKSIFK